ncbi:MAG TPA: Rne/Rng family ribonuclease [Crocinitomicaceae bacterium]|nr:Rne/Rng family ribonuclease [Crocinitomicaceae bacterium]
MSLELIVDSRSNGVWLALLNNGKLIELHQEEGSNEFSVGDIYLGKVHKIVTNLNAAFVDVGYERDAFLHYLDLGPQFNSLNQFVRDTLSKKQKVANLQYFKLKGEISKEGKIGDLISSSQPILVQIAKEPISTKGPRLSAEITLAGRYLVLVPFTEKVSISQKIKDSKERERLRGILEEIRPKNFGVIIRTVAENKKVEEINQDLQSLVDKWKILFDNLVSATPKKRVLGEMDKTSTILRDLLNSDFSNIHVNDEKVAEVIKEYVSNIAPEKEKIVKVYDGKHEIFERFGINKQIKALFGKKVRLPSGGYLIIEATEAMHVIDVNSGNRKDTDNQESNALVTNLEAAEELSRLFKLRDMGGIIAIDFIDMHEKENNRVLFEKMKEFMKNDRAKHNILPPSKFGVMEITRQRVRPETDIITSESCPACNGTGEIHASIMIIDEIETNLDFLIKDKKVTDIRLVMHPYLEAYFKKRFFAKQREWYFKYKKWIPILGNSSYHYMQYVFTDKNNVEIEY